MGAFRHDGFPNIKGLVLVGIQNVGDYILGPLLLENVNMATLSLRDPAITKLQLP